MKPVNQPSMDSLKSDDPVTWEDIAGLQTDLKQAARALLAQEGNAGTVHTTQLVNSALKKLVPKGRDWTEISWANRRFFFADAHLAMRRVLIQYARARNNLKRGAQVRVGGFESEFLRPLADGGVLNLDRLADQAATRAELAEAIDRALAELDRLYPGKDLAEIVQLRSFEGLTQEEIARVLDLSSRTVRDREKLAYALLRKELAAFFNQPETAA